MMIEVEDLRKTYQTYQRGANFREAVKSLFVRKKIIVEALKGISFQVGPGELIGFIGPNGAGKSTALKILSGILYPTSGRVEVLDYVPWRDRKQYVRNIGAVFGQKSQLIWDLPPVDAFHLNKAVYDLPDDLFQRNLDRMVNILDAGSIIKKPTRQLSLGERMKCEFIMSMLHEPKIVFLDEPTIGLDVIAKENIREFILEMNAQGVTFLLTTHDIDDLEHLARRVIMINHGELIFQGSLGELRNRLGVRKIVQLSLENPAAGIDIDGVTVLAKISDYEYKLELDLDVTRMNVFIEQINRDNRIRDLIVQEMPIEDAIKDLYGT